MAKDQSNDDTIPEPSTQTTVLTTLGTVAGIIAALVGLVVYLYDIANGGARPGPLIVAVVASFFVLLAGWRLVKRSRPRAVIVPAVLAVGLVLSYGAYAKSGHSTPPTPHVSPLRASVIAMRPLPTKTPAPRYVVEVKVIDQPPSDRSLWLVSVLYAEPGKVKDTLYFVKAPVPSATGTHQVPIRYCKPLAKDLQRALKVVAADDATSKILARNRLEEDNCIENSDMTNLAGATPVSDALKFIE